MTQKNGVTERDGVQEYQCFVGCQWRAADSKRTFDVAVVVDPTLRVHHVRALRTADASVRPNITAEAANAPTIMIGGRSAASIQRATGG
jgi:choline dehydrogenase-like flavoprotein